MIPVKNFIIVCLSIVAFTVMSSANPVPKDENIVEKVTRTVMKFPGMATGYFKTFTSKGKNGDKNEHDKPEERDEEPNKPGEKDGEPNKPEGSKEPNKTEESKGPTPEPKKLTFEELKNLTPEQIAKLEPIQFSNIKLDQFKDLSLEQRKAVTSEQKKALSKES